MRILLGIAIVLGATALGALAPLLFRGQMGTSVGTSVICSLLRGGPGTDPLTAEQRKALVAAALSAPTIDAKSRAIVERATDDGCKLGRGR